MITSKENELIKHIKSLNQKKYRDEYGEYFIEGIKQVTEAIEECADIKQIIICEELLQKSIDVKNFPTEFVSDKVFKSISDTQSPQGILAVLSKKEHNKDFSNVVFALDDVQDPGNVGTIIRSLDCAGIKNLIVSNGTADVYNPKVVRSTMGAIYRIQIDESNDLMLTLVELQKKGYKVIVTTLDTDNYYDTLKFDEKVVIVIGNESKGIKKEIQNLADIKVKIPLLGKTESLNAGVAASIIAYEYVRKVLYL